MEDGGDEDSFGSDCRGRWILVAAWKNAAGDHHFPAGRLPQHKKQSTQKGSTGVLIKYHVNVQEKRKRVLYWKWKYICFWNQCICILYLGIVKIWFQALPAGTASPHSVPTETTGTGMSVTLFLTFAGFVYFMLSSDVRTSKYQELRSVRDHSSNSKLGGAWAITSVIERKLWKSISHHPTKLPHHYLSARSAHTAVRFAGSAVYTSCCRIWKLPTPPSDVLRAASGVKCVA